MEKIKNKEQLIKKILLIALIIFIYCFFQALLESGNEAMSEVKEINESLQENNKLSKEATELLELQLQLHELDIMKSKIDSLK